MAIRNIITSENETLRKKSRPIEAFDEKLHTLIDDLWDTLGKAQGVGLAAPQIGILRRVVVIDTGESGRIELVNPEIVKEKGKNTADEGCLSIPNIHHEVTRPGIVLVRAFDRNGNEFSITGRKLLARAFCHEIDHLEGILFTDYIK